MTAVAAIVTAVIPLSGCSADDQPPAERPVDVAALAAATPANPALDRVDWTPAPTTVSGYRTLFRSIDPYYWGAADVSISAKKPGTGYRVWLYGDTMSKRNGFVHSTAIVQRGGAVRVSRNGEQLLPDGPTKCKADGTCRDRIYWIEAARFRADGGLVITAAPMSVGTASVWDFHRPALRADQSRLALARVSDAGDVTFTKWLRWVERPLLTGDGEDFTVIGEHHFTYQEVVHDIRLADGTWLKTVCQNWDDGAFHTDSSGEIVWADYRPLWRSSPTQDLGITAWPDHVPPTQ